MSAEVPPLAVGRHGCPACPARFDTVGDKKRHLRTVHEPKPAGPAPAAAVCPECVTGKHCNCDGRAWDDAADELTSCTCDHSGGAS